MPLQTQLKATSLQTLNNGPAPLQTTLNYGFLPLQTIMGLCLFRWVAPPILRDHTDSIKKPYLFIYAYAHNKASTPKKTQLKGHPPLNPFTGEML